MDNVNYEEGYFKLKKSNEEFVILFNKVVSDLKQSKINYVNERNKNTELTKQIETLSDELTKKILECENQSKEISNLSDELNYLKTYSKAVEGVAEKFCGKCLTAQRKYDELNKQSRNLSSSSVEGSNVFDMDEVDSTLDNEIPDTFVEIEKIRKSHDEIMKEKEKRYKKLERENEQNIKRKNYLRLKIEKMNAVIEDKDKRLEKLNADMNTILRSYETLKVDHEKLISYFTPFFKMKAENVELKRTNALLMNDVNDDKTIEFLHIIEHLKEEITVNDFKVVEMERKLSEKDDSILEITALRTEIEDLSEKYETIRKEYEAVRNERDTLKNENRILIEQKDCFGLAPLLPPPPPPPPLPFMQQSNILNIFKKKNNNSSSFEGESNKNKTERDQVLSNLMNELEQKLLARQNMNNKLI